MDAEQIARYPVVVKENPATHLVSDAEFALECARAANERNDDEATTRFARMAILLYAISLASGYGQHRNACRVSIVSKRMMV